MVAIKKVYISGLGAVGSAYAGQIYQTDPEALTVIADPERVERYRREGVSVNGTVYPFRFETPQAVAEPADLILIAVKQHQLTASIEALRNCVGQETIILSLLNGITSEETVGAAYGLEKVLYSFVVGTDAVRLGTQTRYSRLGKIVFGEPGQGNDSPKVQTVREFFDRVGVPYEVPEDILRELWWKFMMNVGVNQISAVLKAPYGVFQNVGEARQLLGLASGEVLSLAERAGINLTAADIDQYLEIIATLAPEGKTSMLQDVEAGRKTEVESFAGTVTALGRQYGIATPVNDLLWRMIRTLEQSY